MPIERLNAYITSSVKVRVSPESIARAVWECSLLTHNCVYVNGDNPFWLFKSTNTCSSLERHEQHHCIMVFFWFFNPWAPEIMQNTPQTLKKQKITAPVAPWFFDFLSPDLMPLRERKNKKNKKSRPPRSARDFLIFWFFISFWGIRSGDKKSKNHGATGAVIFWFLIFVVCFAWFLVLKD